MTAVAQAPVTARPRRRSRRRGRTALLYLLPALIIVVGITYVGVGYNGYVSTLEWSGIGDATPVGFANYLRIAVDPIFWASVGHVGIFAILTILTQMVIGFLMALVLAGPVAGKNVYRIIVFLPVVLAPAAIATAFRQILAADGQFNSLLEGIGLGSLAQAWTADPTFALYALAAVNIWQWTGFSFLLYQAALGQIDHSHIEAAQIDGASSWRITRSIILPQLSGTHATLALTGVIGSIKTFEIVWLITGGGPGRRTEFLTTYIYKNAVVSFDTGYAAALSVVLLVLALALTAIQMRAYRFGGQD